MSWLRRIFVIACLVAIASCSGCCLFSTCPGGGLGCDGVDPGCGLESYYQGGCTDGGCEGCGDGPVIPCRAGASPGGCGLGLGCLGRLLGMTQGCNGCGETYYHGWINDPPCCDPCDGCGNYTGDPTGGCGYGGVGCDSCGLGGAVSYDPGCGMAAGPVDPGCGVAEPGCGLASGCDSCGSYGGRTAFQVPGRAIYATWTGLGGALREFRRGFLPSCRNCNAFSLASSCSTCVMAEPACGCGGGGTDVYFGGAGAGNGGCSSCAQSNVVTQPGPALAQHRPGKLPHEVVSRGMKATHGRPPHPVVANRLRQYR